MRIAFFIGQMKAGGAEKVLSVLANHYAAKGWDVDIIMLLGDCVNSSHFDLNPTINVVNLSRKGSYFKNIIPWLISIRRHIKRTRPSVVVSFIGRINALVLTALLGKNIPVIVSERSDPNHDGRGLFMAKYCNWIYRFSQAIVFQTNYQKNCFPKTLDKKAVVIPNPIKVVPKPENQIDRLICTSGRLHPCKNQHMLIDAISFLIKDFPDVKCHILGDGELFDKLNHQIIDLNISNNVILLGNKKNINEYVSKCSVFVMTSEFEGLSNALMEAMMLGKICISTDYAGVEDLITDGVDGLIIPRGDTRALANALSSIFHDQSGQYTNLGKNAREKMMGYEIENILKQWDQLISNFL